jgi:hypothetical protein
MAADTSGIFSVDVAGQPGARSTSLGDDLEWAGTSRTSSKVRASIDRLRARGQLNSTL